ncbi:hypothetical protein BL250_12315 [Erwinia sp. OLTSP20]|uniref:type IV pilus biogenesis protein PilM n=1 Tax=Enterobacterales TaxID=91347 RepID=UPI000C19B32B|nr:MULTISPECIES: type IV pilus biogenesis protein PilM [Enterobacterales]PII85123.1 hypothetical protein BMF91_23895 [Serratia sp. OLFL2]PIJ49345.1 hypothetical protein BV501_12970 [Erwinia sp. OAMSP11]PIJ69741.1 hypothetical protein BK416_13800 [Erwinia sp. OLSSP12]PIJ76225.1 hypothetical protein BLD47_18055 [Erwinia sp. OLCASP19]PIJ76746.1 hypothetical protein BLD46_18280 [Erwinia sp. OLMTSP26]
MNFSALTIMACALFISISIAISGDSKKDWDIADEQSKAGQFMNYAYAFDEYKNANKSATGDVTANLLLPQWLPKNSAIKTVISNGVGYVYTPSSKGLMNELMIWTDNSSSVGVTDATSINTLSGVVTKPSFIGSGYIVYIR